MGKVEIAPSTARDTGVTLATAGGCVIYFAVIAWFSDALGFWSARLILAALIIGAIFVAAGAIITAIDKGRR